MGHRIGSIAIGTISAAALVVTFTNSLGAIASRGDVTQAERARAKDDVAADRAELARIGRERAGMNFPPATDDTVAATRDAVIAAERIRAAECGNGDPKQRGPNCRQRETEEQARREALTTALANKAASDRATSLDSAAAVIRARLATALPVQNPNPLGAALALLLGAGAAALTAWQQAIVAAVFELCLVGVMVIFELLGHVKVPSDRSDASVEQMASPCPTCGMPGDNGPNTGPAPRDRGDQPQKQDRWRQDVCAGQAVSRRWRANGDQGFDAELSRLVRTKRR